MSSSLKAWTKQDDENVERSVVEIEIDEIKQSILCFCHFNNMLFS